MKVLLVYTNTYRMIAPPPLGMSLVAARLRRDGHDVRFLDLMFSRSPAADAARAAREFRPDLVGYSIRNVDNQSPTDFFDPLPGLKSVVEAVRAVCYAPTLLGGTAFTTFPTQFLQELGADYGIAGDDLDPISRFVASLEAGRPDLTTPGLVWREGETPRSNPFQIRGYADTPFEGFDFVDYRRYRRCLSAFWEGGLVVRTGCPFKCVFCDTHKTFGSEWVLRDPRQVAKEAVALARRGARSAFFADGGFNRPLDHAKQVLEAIVRAGVRLSFTSVFEPGEVDREFAALYRRAGGVGVALFATSLSEQVLDRARKPFQVADAMDGARLLHEAGVYTFLYLTLGLPGETPETVQETIRNGDAMRSIYTLVDHGLRVQPNTELQRIAVAEGQITAEDDCFRATFYHSPETPAEMLGLLLKRYQAERQRDQIRALPWMAKLAWDKLRP